MGKHLKKLKKQRKPVAAESTALKPLVSFVTTDDEFEPAFNFLLVQLEEAGVLAIDRSGNVDQSGNVDDDNSEEESEA